MDKITISLTAFLVFSAALTSLPQDKVLFAQEKGSSRQQMKEPSTFDRISRAADFGEISLKEAVLLKAKLLFAPSLIPEGSKFAPKPGETLVQEDCLTGFYKDVHRVFPELSGEERKFLRSLSPDLEAIIRQREKE
jgi:hypothetical protein